MRKTIRTSRRNVNNIRESDIYSKRRKESYNYRTANDRKNNSANVERRRSARKEYGKNEEINFFVLKAVISSLCVLIIIIVSNTDIGFTDDIKSDIKTALSENISYENIGDIINRIENVFADGEEVEDLQESEYTNSDFRIDENIVEQMNNEEDFYYNRQ